jgi:hypothetical protein
LTVADLPVPDNSQGHDFLSPAGRQGKGGRSSLFSKAAQDDLAEKSVREIQWVRKVHVCGSAHRSGCSF